MGYRYEDLQEGDELVGRTLTATMARTKWYGSAMLSAATGEPRQVGSNIHTDAEFARQQGLEDAIIDGMMSTNWISSMLLEYFGHHYLERGELRAKFIRPIFVNEVVNVGGRVEEIVPSDGIDYISLVVWCNDLQGSLRTEGDAKIGIGPATLAGCP